MGWEEKCEEPKVSGGGDLGAQRCDPSTHEVYCASKGKCIRPWEEGCGEETLLKAGGDLDANGCKPSTGEQYCATLHKCIRPWEESAKRRRSAVAAIWTPTAASLRRARCSALPRASAFGRGRRSARSLAAPIARLGSRMARTSRARCAS